MRNRQSQCKPESSKCRRVGWRSLLDNAATLHIKRRIGLYFDYDIDALASDQQPLVYHCQTRPLWFEVLSQISAAKGLDCARLDQAAQGQTPALHCHQITGATES